MSRYFPTTSKLDLACLPEDAYAAQHCGTAKDDHDMLYLLVGGGVCSSQHG